MVHTRLSFHNGSPRYVPASEQPSMATARPRGISAPWPMLYSQLACRRFWRGNERQCVQRRSRRQTTLNELFVALRGTLAKQGVDCRSMRPVHKDFRPGSIRHSLADISGAATDFGYTPDVSLNQGSHR